MMTVSVCIYTVIINNNRVHTKIATIFHRLFKDHIRFSRTTYYEYNFTDCTKMHIPSLF